MTCSNMYIAPIDCPDVGNEIYNMDLMPQFLIDSERRIFKLLFKQFQVISVEMQEPTYCDDIIVRAPQYITVCYYEYGGNCLFERNFKLSNK